MAAENELKHLQVELPVEYVEGADELIALIEGCSSAREKDDKTS